MKPGAVTAAVMALALVACSSTETTSPLTAPPPTSTRAAPSTAVAPTVPARVTASAGCAAPAMSAGVSDRTMVSNGVERRYQLTVPEGYDGTTPVPVVLGLHALTVPYQIVPAISGFPDMAASYDFIGVAPSGQLDGSTPYWVAAPTAQNHDVRFIADLLDLLEAELCVDPSRVYATGMSNGAQMSSVLACQLADRIAAVGPVAGVEFYGACDGPPVAVLAIHGTNDAIVTYEGGGLNAASIADIHFWKGSMPSDVPQNGGVDASMQSWATHNGCDPEPTETEVSGEVRRREWSGCDAPTILYVVDGGGHSWPGKPVPEFEAQFGPTTTDIDASSLIFSFFFDR